MKNYIDIHCHSVMTHYRNKELNISACNEIHNELFTGTENLRSFYTQSNFAKLVKGDVGAIVISLYPIERKFLLPNFPIEGALDKLISNITGFSASNIKSMLEEEHRGTVRYYDDLLGEYNYLLSQANTTCDGKEIKIVANYDEYLSNKQAGNVISIIISIEGAHSLGTITSDDLTKAPEEITIEDYNTKYRDNLFAMKKWGPNGSHTPFFITLSHHFWNMLAGHAESLPFLFDQKTGKESGFTPAGLQLMKDLLSTSDENGTPNKKRRVLIDVKHMSPSARKQYYEYLDEVRRTKGINIPVICSHATTGDAPSLDHFINGDNENNEPDNYFTTTSLSLNDEDIRKIIDSDGIMGIVLHEGRIANKKAMKESRYGINDLRKSIRKANKKIERFQKELKTDVTDRRKERLVEKISERMKQIDEYGNKMREGYTQMILANIYRIVEVYSNYKPQQKEKGWDHIGIGSDFDGMINKMDYLGTANEFPLLEELMIKFLKNPEALEKFDPSWTPERLKELQFGKSPEELAAKIMSRNAEVFLQKYFNEGFLMKDEEPVSGSGDNLTA